MTTIDKKVPMAKLLMILPRGTIYKEAVLPEGFGYVTWDESLKDAWCNLHLSTGVFDDEASALDELKKIDPEKMILVKNTSGELVGSGVLMNGEDYGMKRISVQHMSVREKDQFQGIGRAILSKLALDYESSPGKYPLYAVLTTGAYGAVILLSRMGFTPYMGEFKGCSEKQSQKNWEAETELLKEKTQNR